MSQFNSELDSIEELNKKMLHFQHNLQFFASTLQDNQPMQMQLKSQLNSAVSEVGRIQRFYIDEYQQAADSTNARQAVLSSYKKIADAVYAFEQNPYDGIKHIEKIQKSNEDYLDYKVYQSHEVGFCDVLSTIFWLSCASFCFMAALGAALTIPVNPFWGTAQTLLGAAGFIACLSLATPKGENSEQYDSERQSVNELSGSLQYVTSHDFAKNTIRGNANSLFAPVKAEVTPTTTEKSLYPDLSPPQYSHQ
jgi:Txe/YoeB family toxin of Txe-Axe toxin-antitoxin module